MRLPSPFRSLASLAGLLAVTAALLVAPATAASAAGEEADFASRLNGERAAAGIPRLGVVADLTAVARAHSARMGQAGNLHHNPYLRTQVTNWNALAENVGTGDSVLSVHRALMGSTGHRANILNRLYTEVGVGTWISPTGRVWVTQVFRTPVVPTAITISEVLAPTVAAHSGLLGAPTGSAYDVPGGIAQDFAGGDVLYSPATKGRVVFGAIRGRYRALGSARSALGLPAADEHGTSGRYGSYTHFQHGSIFWSPTSGAHEVRGGIRDAWARLGWHTGSGFPVTGELPTPGVYGSYYHF